MTQDTEYPSRQLVVQFMTSRQPSRPPKAEPTRNEATRDSQQLACWSDQRERQPVPVLTLTGKWMIDAGFTIRTLVNVRVRHEELLITVRH